MKLCKTWISRIMAFAMLLSVIAGTASAFSVSDLDKITSSIFTSFLEDMVKLEEPILTAEFSTTGNALTIQNSKYFIVSAPDREYTVENKIDISGCYLYISCTKYQVMTVKELREKYESKLKDKSVLSDLPSYDAPIYLKSAKTTSWEDQYYLTSDLTWEAGSTSAALRIKTGEKVTFTLPDAQEDDLYYVEIHVSCPSSDAFFPTHQMTYSFTNVLIDTDGDYPTSAGIKESSDGLSYNFSTYHQLMSGEIDIPAVIRGNSSELTGVQTPNSLAVFSVSTSRDVKLASSDQQYTISNTGTQDISITLLMFRQESTASLIKKYNSPLDKVNLEKMLKDVNEVYFADRNSNSFYYLTTDLTFESNINSRSSERVLQLHPGESVTFTLPDAVEGQFYRINVEPDIPLKFFDILISEEIETPATMPVFTDVSADAYYAAPVAWAVENGITTGTTETTFSPDTTCTNAQIITLLWRANASPAPRPAAENPFTDVTENDFYYQAALWAYENGLVEGSSFNGSAPCTRAMTVTCLWKLAGSPDAPDAGFTDVDSGAEYAKAVAWALREGITTGTGDATFSPDMTCTRAQIVTLLYRALEN